MPVCLDSRLWVIPWQYAQLLSKEKSTRWASQFKCRTQRYIHLSTKQQQPQPLKPLSWQAELSALWPVYPQLSQIKKECGKQKKKNACISPYNSKRIIRPFAPQLLPKVPPGCRASDFWRASFLTGRPSACCYLSPGGAGGKHVTGACLFLTS